jgi:peptidoglycan/xylan/chitin deacetylase (PgdA/CDA1 family)
VSSVVILGAGASLAQRETVRFVGKTKYLNNAKAVVVHTIDDSTKLVVDIADAMDKYDIKGTFFISTEMDPPPEERFFNQLQVWLLWPRMKKAVENGHEVGSHAVTHPCSRPQSDTTSDTYKAFCDANYNDSELIASRDEILKRTGQPYVWTWAYPCGHCANLELIQKRIAAAGYIVARNYPGEAQGLHVRPDLQTWASNPYDAPYTQVVQRAGGRRGATAPPIVVADLNAKFDEVYGKGGIYHFMSHPQSLDFGPEGFYEQHLAHISRRPDVWYVPMGPVYAFKTIVDATEVRPLASSGGRPRFSVSNTLDRKIYSGSLTLEFAVPAGMSLFSAGKKLEEPRRRLTDRWDEEYVRREGDRVFVTVRPTTTLEFR